ncbi:MAG: protein kinase domain-containing protein [Acidobacteriota bacterium]
MTLQPGTHLGLYEIIAPLGAGGMGEVYRARDGKLGREVALKVLPDGLAHDPERLARLEREARLLAALNHPKIGAIYGLEESKGTRFLVLELVPGETLDQRIRAGALPISESLEICRQIAEALEAAHDKGIIHRDLKPSNIKVTAEGSVKVLDFGLAKAFAPDESSANISLSPTITQKSLADGVIMGTAAYMSPEQARGKPLDRRTDIWSFGCVLYECLTGGLAFSGETISDVLARILEREPNLNELPPATPNRIHVLLRRCLQKDRNRRLQHIGDARVEIEESLADPAAAALPVDGALRSRRASRREMIAWAAASLFFVAAIVLALTLVFRTTSTNPERVSVSIMAPEKTAFFGALALSPDGRRLAFVGASEGRTLLWLRTLDSVKAQPLAGTDGASLPFWSPDSRFIGFFANGKLKKVEFSGGSPQTLCDVTFEPRGGAWSKEGTIVFAPNYDSGILQVSSAGGPATPVTRLDPSQQQTSHRFPVFLPDGRHFMYWARSMKQESSGLYAGSLDSQDTIRLVAAAASGSYVAPGYLLFLRDRTLLARPFDASELKFTGDSFPIADDVVRFGEVGPTGYACFSASDNGSLVYWNGGVLATQPTWFDRSGKAQGTLGPPGDYSDFSLSPDEKRLSFARTDPKTIIGDIWNLELSRGIYSRFTFHPAVDVLPLWSADGRRIAFASNRDGPFNLYQKLSDGAGSDEVLLKSSLNMFPSHFSRDGRFLVYEVTERNLDIWVLPLFGERKPQVFLQTEFNETHAQVSPDGRWIAYASDETGASEVYVRTFPSATGGKWQISAAGGDQPQWRRDGKELFYIGADKRLMAVEIGGSGGLEVSAPKLLFQAQISTSLSDIRNSYAVTGDGKRFLVNVTVGDSMGVPMTLVLNAFK